MCQLTLVNLGDKTLNKVFLSSLLKINSSLINKDGTGLFSMRGSSYSLWKTELSADSINNLGLILNQQVTNATPVIAHVRAASKGIVVTQENAHPFKGDRFVLAHNGRLYNSGDEVSYMEANSDSSLDSDSKRFLDEMEKENTKNPGASIVDILNTCMANHMGKFALLIYDSAVDKMYVVRGETADLHKVTISTRKTDDTGAEVDTPVGFIVNTKKNCLSDALELSLPIAQIASKGYYVSGEIEELKKNTVYEVSGSDLVEVGTVKENVVVYKSSYITAASTGANYQVQKVQEHVDLTNPTVKLVNRINIFAEDHFLTIMDIDSLFYLFLGIHLHSVTIGDLKDFVDKVIPVTSAPDDIRTKLRLALGNRSGAKVYPLMYTKVKDLEFPWTLNSKENVEALINEIVDFRKASG